MTLTFVNLGLLAGAAAVIVPIVLHLVMRQQPKLLEFPALRFLQQRQRANRRRFRLRNLLLLALRVAALLLLAAALARPTIHGSALLGDQEAPVAAVFVFDTSPRMDYRHQNQSRLEAAQEMARWVLRQLPRESEVAVVDSRTVAPAFAVDLAVARQQVERLKIAAVPRPVPAMIQAALALLDQRQRTATPEQPLRYEIYVFSDLARAAWETAAQGQLQAELARREDLGLHVIDVGVAQPRNFALGSVRLPRQVLSERSPLSIAVDLERTGPDEARGVELLVSDASGQLRKRGHELVQGISGQAQEVEFRLTGLAAGTHQGVIRIVGEDGLKWDDVRYFSVEVRPPLKVLAGALREEQGVYFEEAISPGGSNGKASSRFDCQVVDLVKLAAEDWSKCQAVCLLDPPPLPDELWRRLADFATGGGAVAVFLGPSAQLDAFNKQAAQAVLPGPLRRQSREETYLAPRDLSHPLLARFRAVESGIPWQQFPVFRYWQVGALADGAAVVLPYASGEAALIERPLGKGRVCVMTTPVSYPPESGDERRWNLLTVGIGLTEPWPFVMLANEMLMYLVGSQDERFNYLAGETAVLRAGPDRPPPAVLVDTPGGDQLRQNVDTRQDVIRVANTEQPGNYRVRAGGSEGGFDRGFSVNVDPAVSQLDRLPPDGLKSLLGQDRFRVASQTSEIDRNLTTARVGRELFPYLMALVAVVLAVEHALANRFYRSGTG